MKVIEVITNSEINLNNKNFIASGGEGSVYKVQNKCYKVYTDPSKMLPTGKIQELQKLHSKNIINPISLLADQKGKYIGYSMNYAADCVTLCSIFPQTFKTRNNIQLKDINNLVSIMKSIFEEFHKNKMLIVDANEYNFLVKDKYFNDMFLIDVDSCQTPSYPATAIMESIRDFHTPAFSFMSDWFSFAILTFQMYTGLHPFKGKHPTISSFPDRMKQNISVYDKEVSVPAFVKDFENMIPINYNEWYKHIFTSNKREVPPASFTDKVVKVIKKVIQKIGNFDINLEGTGNENIINAIFSEFFRETIYLTSNGLWVGEVLYNGIAPYSEIYITKQDNTPYVYSCITKNNKLLVRDVLNKKDIVEDISAEHIMSAAPSNSVKPAGLYTIFNNNLNFIEIFPKYQAVLAKKITDLAFSYKVFPGVILQPVLGSVYATLLRGIPGVLENIHLKELGNQRILNAELKDNVLIVVTEFNGNIKRHFFRFYIDGSYFEKYSHIVQENVQDSDLNFIVLDTGICILADSSQGIILLRTNPDDSTINILNDNMIIGHKLVSKGNKAYFIQDNCIYNFKMK